MNYDIKYYYSISYLTIDMNRVNLIYWKNTNFGDELGPALIEEFSGRKVQYKDIGINRIDRLKAVLKLDLKKVNTIYFPHQKVFSSIGSILSWLPKGTIVWGSGFMNSNEKFKGGKILAVRGKLTERLLKLQGHKLELIYGDPALLLPLWIKPEKFKKYKLGIIPHWSEYEYFKDTYGEQHHVIDLRSNNIKDILSEITSCEYILSSSLHGIIVAHSYQIPALWIKHGNIGTDGFKFHDYFSSVEIPKYNGFENIENLLSNEGKWHEEFNNNKDISLIKASLQNIQFKLLRSMPFGLKDKYRIILNNLDNK